MMLTILANMVIAIATEVLPRPSSSCLPAMNSVLGRMPTMSMT